jgi:hypothetical protein
MPVTGILFLEPICEKHVRPLKRRCIVAKRNAHVFHPGVLKASRKLLDPEVYLGVGFLTGLARMAEAQTARDGSVLDHMPPLKRFSGKLKVQVLIVQGASSCLVWAPDGLGICVHDWDLPSDERRKGGIPECGGEGGGPLLLGVEPRLSGLTGD